MKHSRSLSNIIMPMTIGGGGNSEGGFVYTKTGLMITKGDPVSKE